MLEYLGKPLLLSLGNLHAKASHMVRDFSAQPNLLIYLNILLIRKTGVQRVLAGHFGKLANKVGSY